MTTALDTNILLDILTPDAPYQESTRVALAAALNAGSLVISDAVYAELASNFLDGQMLDRFLESTGVQREPLHPEALFLAGIAWREYSRNRSSTLTCPECGMEQAVQCTRCGRELRPRQHLLADFLIGAHAMHHADRLLTRDRGFYRRHFPELRLT